MLSAGESDDSRIGRLLRTRRTRLGMTQADVGAAIGVSAQQVQKYESGVNSIMPSRLSRVAKALDVPVSFFFPDETNAAAAARTDERSSNATREFDGTKLLASFAGIRDQEVRMLLSRLVTRLGELMGTDSLQPAAAPQPVRFSASSDA